MSVLTQLTVPGEARPLKIAPEAIYTSSLDIINYKHITMPYIILQRHIMTNKAYFFISIILIFERINYFNSTSKLICKSSFTPEIYYKADSIFISESIWD